MTWLASLHHLTFYSPRRLCGKRLTPASSFSGLIRARALKLDIYPRELILGELQRSEPLELFEGVFVPVVARTDAALSKLIWIAKGSQRSRRDLRGIFANCEPKQPAAIRK